MFGITPGEAIDTFSHSEYRILRRFIIMEEEKTTADQHYLMQIAAEVRRGWVSKPNKVKISDFHLELTKRGRGDKPDKATQEARTKFSKGVWKAAAHRARNEREQGGKLPPLPMGIKSNKRGKIEYKPPPKEDKK